VVDIFGGEKLLYIDMLLETFLKDKVPVKTYLYYDIACKFAKHLKNNPNIEDDWKDKFILAVPKFHVWAHALQCILRFNPSSIEGTGLIDGEVMERIWTHVGLFYTIMKEMNAANRTSLLEV
jgi:hypothetical protein